MSALETDIDALYALPLPAFTSARNALAKSLSGEARARVKALEKPAVVPWAVNQVYWRDRPAYTRLMAAGARLRTEQIAALTGRPAGLRDAAAEHRGALASAVAAALQASRQHGAHPSADDLSRMLESISLAPELAVAPGRFTEAVQPAGFEALAGVTPVAHSGRAPSSTHPPSPVPGPESRPNPETAAAHARAAAAALATRREAEADVEDARTRLANAELEEADARKAADAARRQLTQAEHAAQTARVLVERARADLAQREERLRSL